MNTLVGLFIIALTQSDLSNISFRLLSLERPKEPEIEIISTKVTAEDKKDAWTDEFGVKYSKDGKKLLGSTYYSLKNYTIRQGTRSICDFAFSSCTSLQSVTIPKSVTSIGDSAFWGCSSLQSVTIPDSVTSIGNWVFYSCTSLQSVTIPESVTNIKGNPFSYCPAKVINHSNHFTIFEGNLYTSDRRKLISYLSKGNNFSIPDSVTSIGDGAFSGCSSLHSVIIPDSVTSIGYCAFLECI